jgi:hypothetical protein
MRTAAGKNRGTAHPAGLGFFEVLFQLRKRGPAHRLEAGRHLQFDWSAHFKR